MNSDATRAGRVTAVDVAHLAGVARSTVSSILGGSSHLFSPDTQDKVRAAADALGYRPSRAGRALVTGFSDILIVLVPNATFGRQLQDAIDQVESVVSNVGLSVLVRYAGDDLESTLTSVLDLRPVAVLDLGVFGKVEHDRIRASGTRIVPDFEVDQLVEDPSVTVGKMQAAHLLDVSPRQLVCVTFVDKRHDYFGATRLHGVAMEAARRGAPAPRLMTVALSIDSVLAAMRELLESCDLPLGMCCFNDDVAAAVITACGRLNLSVPGEVSVIGADRADMGQLMTPRLTTINSDLPGMLATYVSELATDTPPVAAGRGSLDLAPFITLVRGETV